MKKNILITGKPHSGKTTVLQKIIPTLINPVGFVTEEIMGEERRVGFQLVTSLGQKEILAHVDFETPYKVSRYSVDVSNLEKILEGISDFQEGDSLYIDEIGQMELFSDKFKDFVLKYLDSPNPCVATISSVYEDSFTTEIKNRNDITLIEITEENRQEKEEYILSLIQPF